MEQTRQKTWYSKKEKLTLNSLIKEIKQTRSYDPIDTGVILSELYLNDDTEGLLNLRDAAIEIEMAGIKNSLNVAVAFGIIAYHFRGRLKGHL